MDKGLQLFMVIGFSILVGGITGYFAEQRGRNSLLWFLIGVFFGLLGLIALFLLPAAKKGEELVNRPQKPLLPASTPPFERSYWFYLDAHHQQKGPVSFEVFKQLWQEKIVTSRTYVWSQDMKDWKRLESLPEVLQSIQK